MNQFSGINYSSFEASRTPVHSNNIPKEQIYGFNAQGEPIIDPTQTMLYRSHQLLNNQNKTHQAYKAGNNSYFQPVNETSGHQNTYNQSFSGLEESLTGGPSLRQTDEWRASLKRTNAPKYQRIVDQFDYASFQTEAVEQMTDSGQTNPKGTLPPPGLPLPKPSVKAPQTDFRPQVYNQGFENMAYNANYTGQFQQRPLSNNPNSVYELSLGAKNCAQFPIKNEVVNQIPTLPRVGNSASQFH